MPRELDLYRQDTKQYGLLIVKPEGVRSGVDMIVSSLLDLPSVNEGRDGTSNPVRDWVLATYSAGDRSLMLDKLPRLRTELTLFKDTSQDNSFWKINYVSHLPNHYHEAVMEIVSGENVLFFVSYDGKDYPVEELLKKLKGVTHLVRPSRLSKNGDSFVVRNGFGIRGLQEKVAAIVTRGELGELLLTAEEHHPEARQYFNLIESLPDEIIRTSLPRELQRLIFPYVSWADNYQLISDALHSSDNAEIVLNTLIDVIQKSRRNINIQATVQGQNNVHRKIGSLINAFRFAT